MTQKEYINSAVEEFASLFIEKLETMEKAQWQKPWFTQGALRLPENLRGTGYNGSNSIMLMFCQEKEGYKFPIWGTFKQFIELTPKGSSTPVCVNKGEHSIPVLYTSFTVIDKDAHTKIPFEEFKRLSESEKSKYAIYPRLSVYRVFNLDQTNLASACPEKFAEITARFARTDVPNRDMDNYTITELDAMLSAQRWVCPINLKYQDRAYYHTSEDIIVLPEREQFCDNESFYGTLLHEMTHSTGIGTRLARYPEVSNREEYSREELVAELTAAFTLSQYGAVTYIKSDSIAYVQSWIEQLKATPAIIKDILNDVKKAGVYIQEHIGSEQSLSNVA